MKDLYIASFFCPRQNIMSAIQQRKFSNFYSMYLTVLWILYFIFKARINLSKPGLLCEYLISFTAYMYLIFQHRVVHCIHRNVKPHKWLKEPYIDVHRVKWEDRTWIDERQLHVRHLSDLIPSSIFMVVMQTSVSLSSFLLFTEPWFLQRHKTL